MGDMAEKEEGNALALAETKPGMDSSSASSSKARCNPEEQPLFLDMADGKRGKRRRTSPQDHAVLEAAYLKNSKPDKTERAQIVIQVHMGEKEVQIWFQNRRQNDRRRSKPLDADELVARMHNKSPTPPTTTDATSKVDPLATSPVTKSQNTPPPTLQGEDAVGLSDALSSSVEKGAGELEQAAAPTPNSNDAASVYGSGSGRKRHHAEMSGALAIEADAIPTESKEPLKRSSSVRLSMTAEGSVKIRTSNEPTPSPPKERSRNQKSQTKIRRSISLFEDLDAQKINQPSKSRLLNADFGRSRDARTWEFYCDSSAKDALSTQAEAERNGSAVGAINLVRSNSQKSRGFPSPMSPALSKGNVPMVTAKTKSGKPKMMRAKSSLARLQSSERDTSVQKQSSKQSRHVRSPSGDSDKENWAPGTRMSENPLRRTQASNNRRPILQSNESATFRDTRPQSNAAGRASTIKASARGDDLDCIQGLLSLSQGAWR